MSSSLAELTEVRRAELDNNCQLGSSEIKTIAIGTVVRPTRAQVDWAVDDAMRQGVAVRQFPDGRNPRGWYCKAVYTLGLDQFRDLVSIAKNDTTGTPSKLFSLLLSQRMPKKEMRSVK